MIFALLCYICLHFLFICWNCEELFLIPFNIYGFVFIYCLENCNIIIFKFLCFMFLICDQSFKGFPVGWIYIYGKLTFSSWQLLGKMTIPFRLVYRKVLFGKLSVWEIICLGRFVKPMLLPWYHKVSNW